MATLNVRGIDEAAREDIKRAAQARGLSVAQYIERLLELHQRALARTEYDYNNQVQALLDDVGLQEVRL